MQANIVPGHHPAVDAWIAPTARLLSGVSYDLSSGSMLLQFGLMSMLRKAHVKEAVLRLQALQWTGLSGSIAVAPILQPWGPVTVSWTERSAGIPWAAPGGQDNIDIGAWVGTSDLLSSLDHVLEVDVVDAVRKWAAGSVRNRGWMIRGSVRVGGARHPSLGLRPSLFVRYSTTQVLAPAVDVVSPYGGL